MGYRPSKFACILNLIMQIGWELIGCIIAGQIFSVVTVNGGGLSVTIGCVVSALCIGFIATFDIAIVHNFESCALYTHSKPTWGKVNENKKAYGKLYYCVYPPVTCHHYPHRLCWQEFGYLNRLYRSCWYYNR